MEWYPDLTSGVEDLTDLRCIVFCKPFWRAKEHIGEFVWWIIDAEEHHEEFVCCEFVLRSYHNSFASRLLVVMCVEPWRWENKVGFPETPFCVFLGKSFDTLLRMMRKANWESVRIRSQSLGRWSNEICWQSDGGELSKTLFWGNSPVFGGWF